MRTLLIAAILIASCGRSDVRVLRGRKVSNASDAGTIKKDAGPTIADAGLNECALPTDAFNIAPIRTDMNPSRSGRAEVVSISPLNLRFDDGVVFTFGYNRPSLFHLIAPGDVVFATIEVESSGFWVSSFLAVSDLDGSGDLAAAGWTIADGSRISPLEDALEYADDDCAAGGDDTCGPIVTRSVRFRIQGELATLAPGETSRVGPYIVGNGASYRYEGQPRCADIPAGWVAGFIERE